MKRGVSLRTIRTLLGLLLAAFISASVVEAKLRMDRMRNLGASLRSVGDIHASQKQLQVYYDENGFFPTTEQGLQALVVRPESSPRPENWRTLFAGPIKDGWDNELIYRCPGRRYPDRYDLFSAGPDGSPDTADDVWEDWKPDKKN